MKIPVLVNKVDKLLVNHGKKKRRVYTIRNDKKKITLETEEILKILKRLFTDHCGHGRHVNLTTPIFTEDRECY